MKGWMGELCVLGEGGMDLPFGMEPVELLVFPLSPAHSSGPALLPPRLFKDAEFSRGCMYV